MQEASIAVPGKGIARISMRVECDPDAWYSQGHQCNAVQDNPSDCSSDLLVIRSDIQTYMYSGRLNVRAEHAIEALSVCTYYQIEPLVRAYSIFSESYLKVDTVNLLLASALQFDLRESIQRCMHVHHPGRSL